MTHLAYITATISANYDTYDFKITYKPKILQIAFYEFDIVISKFLVPFSSKTYRTNEI